MILGLILLAGCALWAAGEAVMLAGGAISVGAGWTVTLGMTLAGSGIWALKDLPAMVKPGRVGIALSAFGAFSFAMVFIIILTGGVLGAMAQGEVRHAQMVFTPFYLLALAFVVSGLLAFALHFRRAPGAHLILAAIPAALALGHVLRLFLADVPAYHEALSMLLALYLGALGIARLRREGRRTQ